MFSTVLWRCWLFAGYCDSWEISCDNGRCIDDSLRCNGYNPCGDYSDCQLSVGEISGIAVGAVVCFIITLAIIVVCVRRRRRYVVSYLNPVYARIHKGRHDKRHLHPFENVKFWQLLFKGKHAAG